MAEVEKTKLFTQRIKKVLYLNFIGKYENYLLTVGAIELLY
jgi:hypothetical protein